MILITHMLNDKGEWERVGEYTRTIAHVRRGDYDYYKVGEYNGTDVLVPFTPENCEKLWAEADSVLGYNQEVS
jgi:hypothetical protein